MLTFGLRSVAPIPATMRPLPACCPPKPAGREHHSIAPCKTPGGAVDMRTSEADVTALTVCVVVVGFGCYAFGCYAYYRYHHHKEQDRRAIEEIDSRLTPTLDEIPHKLAADRRAFVPDDKRPEWDQYRKELARKRGEDPRKAAAG